MLLFASIFIQFSQHVRSQSFNNYPACVTSFNLYRIITVFKFSQAVLLLACICVQRYFFSIYSNRNRPKGKA